MSEEVMQAEKQKQFEEQYQEFCQKIDDPAHEIVAEDFVHLHNHTHHSLLDGLTKVPDLINYVKREVEIGRASCRERV